MKKDKKNKKSRSLALNGEPELPPPPVPSVNEYDQPPTSPYSTSIIQIIIGGNQYGVPEYYLRPYPRLSPSYSWHRPSLDDINQDIGHTLIHFLYTGTYQTIAPSINDPYVNPRSREFERSVYAYQAARRYNITGLEDIAREYMFTFDDSVTTLEILNIARKVYATLPSDDAWFETFIRDKLVSAFELDGLQFRKDIEQYGVGTEIKFDQFLMAAVMEIYSQKIATLEDAVANRVEDDNVPVEEIAEVAVEIPSVDAPVEEPYEEPPPPSPVPLSPDRDQPYQPPPSSFSSPRPVREPSPGYEPLEPASDQEPEPEPEPMYDPVPEPEPEPMYEAEPEPDMIYEVEPGPEPEIKTFEIPASPLYDNWHYLSSKDRKKREKMLVKRGLPVPGKDIELPLPAAEPLEEPMPVPEPEPEPAPPSIYEPEVIPEALPEPEIPQEDDPWDTFQPISTSQQKSKRFLGKSLASNIA